MSRPRPPAPRARRRQLGLAAFVLISGLVLGACSQSSADGGADGSGPVQMEAEAGAFPVTITHAFGETTIEEAPHRVLAMDVESTDTALALGVVPTSIAKQTYGGDAEGYLPWTREVMDQLVDETPPTMEFYSEAGDIDFERILNEAPDVILAPYSGFSAEEYERLSEIAPTVPFDYKPFRPSSWQAMTTSIGQALGQPTRTAELIGEAEAALAQVQADNPQFQDVSFIYGTYLRDGETEAAIYVPTDPRVKFVEDLGLTIAPDVVTGAANAAGDSFTFGVSLEKLDTVDADVYIGWAGGQEDIDRSLGNALFARWNVIEKGKVLWIDDPRITAATMRVSVLSIPWTIDQFVPALTDVVEGR